VRGEGAHFYETRPLGHKNFVRDGGFQERLGNGGWDVIGMSARAPGGGDEKKGLKVRKKVPVLRGGRANVQRGGVVSCRRSQRERSEEDEDSREANKLGGVCYSKRGEAIPYFENLRVEEGRLQAGQS